MSDYTPFWRDGGSGAGVDPQVLERAAELQREVAALGVVPEASYRIAPALGGTVIAPKPCAAPAESRPPFGLIRARAD